MDARPREVRLRHSSGEIAEQNPGTGSGGDGAKGGGRGECEPVTHAPDTEPGKRVTDAGARTDGRKVLPSLSEVGAGCGKAARPVLGGGTRVTRFPNLPPDHMSTNGPICPHLGHCSAPAIEVAGG
jgi:hypothetical protein